MAWNQSSNEAGPLTVEFVGSGSGMVGAGWGMDTSTATVTTLLAAHTSLDIECLERIYLNGYVPGLQVGGQVVTYMTKHLGKNIPSPALPARTPTG